MKHLPLGDLTVSPRNVRTTDTDLSSLKASIAAHGLLQPLVAIKTERGFEVVAGGRRLAAMQLLAEEGTDMGKVPVTVIDAEQAEEASLAENLVRQAMRPFELWEAITGLSLTQKEIALRFAMPIDQVRKAQRLGRLHPRIMEAYKAGDMTDTVAQAYASTADTDEQLRVFEEMEEAGHSYNPAAEIKRKLGYGNWSISMMFKEVEEEYKAAGGKVERDLFGPEARVLDTDLLHKLYAQHQYAEDQRLAKEVGIEVAEEEPGETYRQLYPNRRASEEDEARIDEIDDTLWEDRDTLDDDAKQALREELKACKDRRKPVIEEEGAVVWQGNFYAPYLVPEHDMDEADAEVDAGPDDILTAKAVTALTTMRTHRFREHIADSQWLKDEAKDMLVFMLARSRVRETEYYGINIFKEDWAWIEEPDEHKAWADFIASGDADQVAAELVGSRYTGLGATGGSGVMATWVEKYDRCEWHSTPEFWDLFRKKDALLQLTDEFAPSFREKYASRKLAEIREAAHKLCSGETLLGITDEDHAGAQSWTPRWLRFGESEEEQQLEEAA